MVAVAPPFHVRSIRLDQKTAPSKDVPLPDWVTRAVQKGADVFHEVEEAARVAP
jgi:hypothetical protein